MGFVDQFLDWAHHGLLDDDDAQRYLLGRGVSMEQWQRHRLGYVAGDFDVDPALEPNHGPACADKDQKHQWCDACRYRSWSSAWEREVEGEPKVQHVGRRIRGCVVLPMTSYSGMCIGFQVRSLTTKSYDTFTLSRRPESYFFGTSVAIESIWATKEVTLVEGPFDQLIMERLVLPNVLALTTSAVSKQQVRFLRRFVRTVNFCTDLDEAGRHGVHSFVAGYGTDFLVRNVKYPSIRPKDKDTNDFWRASGDEAFCRFFRNSVLSTL